MSFFDKAKSEYIRFCDKQGVATRSICDIKIDVFTGDYSLLNKDDEVISILNKDFQFICLSRREKMKFKQSKDYTVYSRINSEGKNAYEIVAETPRGLADGKRYVQSSVLN